MTPTPSLRDSLKCEKPMTGDEVTSMCTFFSFCLAESCRDSPCGTCRFVLHFCYSYLCAIKEPLSTFECLPKGPGSGDNQRSSILLQELNTEKNTVPADVSARAIDGHDMPRAFLSVYSLLILHNACRQRYKNHMLAFMARGCL